MRRHTLTTTLAVAAALTALSGTQAGAQMFRGPRIFTGPGGPTALTPGYGLVTSAPAPSAGTAYSSGYSGFAFNPTVRPYSYYAAVPPTPPREYVDYGNSGFAFYGRPYGHVYDRWSWTAMSNAPYGGVLARYYYPPVR
jgi:hypothetical protein